MLPKVDAGSFNGKPKATALQIADAFGLPLNEGAIAVGKQSGDKSPHSKTLQRLAVGPLRGAGVVEFPLPSRVAAGRFHSILAKEAAEMGLAVLVRLDGSEGFPLLVDQLVQHPVGGLGL
jgi:hypothetical protein